MARKTRREAKAERLTWFAMIMVFVIVSFDTNSQIPPFSIPLVLAVILLASGIYQFTKKWTVSPVLWIAMTIFLAIGGYGWYSPSIPVDPGLVGFVGTFSVILFGILSNEG